MLGVEQVALGVAFPSVYARDDVRAERKELSFINQAFAAPLALYRGVGGALQNAIYFVVPGQRSLVVALEDLTSSLEARDINVELHLDPHSVEGLDPEGERLVYRVAHESLLNAMRHALADRVTVSLHAEGHATVLEVGSDE